MKSIPIMALGLAAALCLGACHHQSTAAKAQADYQAKEKALEQQLARNSQNLDQRVKQLEQQANCGAWAPGVPAPATADDCAKRNAQWQHDQSTDWRLPSIPPKALPPPSKASH